MDTVQALVAKGNQHLTLKEYEQAVDAFGDACHENSSTTGSEDPQLLYLYGKALFSLAMTKSDILGVNASGEPAQAAAASTVNEKFSFAPSATAESDSDSSNDEPAAQEQSDFEISWDVLDLARKLFDEQVQQQSDDVKRRAIQIKLADTYDILGEISLESENFHQAATDLNSALELKLVLYDELDPVLPEAYYKLSLAYEFDLQERDAVDRSIDAMRHAVALVKKRHPQSNDPDLLQDLETRLQELLDSQQEASKEFDKQKTQILKGLMGETASDVQPTVEANDLTQSVRKKRRKDD